MIDVVHDPAGHSLQSVRSEKPRITATVTTEPGPSRPGSTMIGFPVAEEADLVSATVTKAEYPRQIASAAASRSHLLQSPLEPGAGPEGGFATRILLEFLTQEELVAELQHSPPTLDRWAALRIGWPQDSVSPSKRSKMANAQEQPTTD
jgi:hypothetical protein